MIEFLCPEGHKIRCPEERAGRPAKCPKCGVAFRIPTIEELGLEEPGVVDPALAEEESPSAPPLRPAERPPPRRLHKSGRSSSCVRTAIICTGRPVCKAGRANVPSAARAFAFRSSRSQRSNPGGA